MLPPDILELLAVSHTVSGKISVPQANTYAIWDNGQSVWFSPAPEYPPQNPPYPWDGDNTTPIRADLWDYGEDNGATRYVVHPCRLQFANAFSGTGVPHCVKRWVDCTPPLTEAVAAQRGRMSAAMDEWRADPGAARAHAQTLPAGNSMSLYHRWISWRLLQPA